MHFDVFDSKGLSAARKPARHQSLADVALTNRYEPVQFKPLLPDIVSRTVPTRYLVRPLEYYSLRYGFRFFLDEAVERDLQRGVLRARSVGRMII